MEFSYKKSSINAVSDYDYYQISKKSPYLQDCKVDKTMDEIRFIYSSDYVQPIEEIKKASLVHKYQVLINIQYLLEDSKRIMIPMAPENITYDTSFMPKAIQRDVYGEEAFSDIDFLNQYKALIGYVLQNKYSFEDYYQGGNHLFSKHKLTTPYSDVETIEKLIEILHTENKNVQETLQTSMIEVDRKKYKRTKVYNKLLAVSLVGALAGLVYLGFFSLSTSLTLNTAYEQYIQQDYISVLETLDDMPMERMPLDTKYILSISNIRSEALTDQQKNNILSGVTINADERIFDYWIHLGKSQNDEAIDVAKQLGNNEYIAFAYMKQKAYVENDTTLTGAEREEQLEAIDSQLEGLGIVDENIQSSTEDEAGQ